MSNVLTLNPSRALTANITAAAGATATFSLAGTTILTTVYADAALTIPHPNPLSADASGVFPQVFSPKGVNIKAVIRTSAGATLYTLDPVTASDASSFTIGGGISFDDIQALEDDVNLTYSVSDYQVAPGKIIKTTREGATYVVAASGATDHHLATMGGVKLYETGVNFSTRQRMAQAITRGDLADLPDGATVVAGGREFVRLSTATMIDDLPGFHEPWMVQNHLLSSDWQPRNLVEVARFQSVLNSIGTRHPGLTHAHVLGDLIDEASQNTSGLPPAYPFSSFLADFRDRLPVPLDNAFFIPGNHDRDGTGTGQHERAWSMRTYREWMGDEYYATVQGNLMWVYMGDMGGSTGGTITDEVIAWAEHLINRNRDKNIFIGLHHPISGTYLTQTEASNPDNHQTRSSRLSDMLDRINLGAGNVVAVFYGHVGSGAQFADSTAYGTRHLQIGMHIPSNVDFARNDQYYVMKPVHGASTMVIEQWDATANTYLSAKTLTLKYPLQLGEQVVRLRADDRPQTVPISVQLPLDDYRPTITPWQITGGIANAIPTAILGVVDRATDANPTDLHIGIRIDYPVGSGSTPSWDQVASLGALTGAAWSTWARVAGTETLPTIAKYEYLSVDGVRALGSVLRPNGFHIGHDGTNENPGNTATPGATMNTNGYLAAFRTNGLAGYFGRSNTGDLVEFNNGTTRAGVITITGATTVAYTTTSDARLKTDLQDFDGLATILGLSVYDYQWIADGQRGRGVLAQEAHAVAPHAVVEGGDDPDREPWTVDYSKIVPDLVRAVQQLADRVRELEKHCKSN